MKLELDEGSKVLGTHPIRTNGVVTGFSAYEGREVLVILLPKKEEQE